MGCCLFLLLLFQVPSTRTESARAPATSPSLSSGSTVQSSAAATSTTSKVSAWLLFFFPVLFGEFLSVTCAAKGNEQKLFRSSFSGHSLQMHMATVTCKAARVHILLCMCDRQSESAVTDWQEHLPVNVFVFFLCRKLRSCGTDLRLTAQQRSLHRQCLLQQHPL